MHTKVRRGRMARAGAALAVIAVCVAWIEIQSLILAVIPGEALFAAWTTIAVARLALPALARRYPSARARASLICARRKRPISSSNRTGVSVGPTAGGSDEGTYR